MEASKTVVQTKETDNTWSETRRQAIGNIIQKMVKLITLCGRYSSSNTKQSLEKAVNNIKQQIHDNKTES